MSSYSYGDGRIWFQRKKFEPYELLLPYGMTNITDPTGSLTAVREPSSAKRRDSIIADILRGEPGLPEFQIETRLRKTLNYMFGLKDCAVNFQNHMGACSRADNYYSSEIAMHWDRAYRGDMAIDRVSKIAGDDSPVAIGVPWSSEIGPLMLDFLVEFLSQRTILDAEAVLDMAFLGQECLEDCTSQEDAGENGYVSTTAKAGSPANIANVWFTEDKGESWSDCSQRPFAGGEDISSIVVMGTKGNHRVIVACGTADGGPAGVAYADVTEIGTTAWVAADVGDVTDQYINKLFWLDWRRLYAVTDDGYVYRSNDGGVSWTAVLSSAVNALHDVAALGYGKNAGNVWIVGAANTVYMSDDYGDSWTAITGPVAGAGDVLLTLALTPDGTVIIGNDAGEIYGSYDTGASWTTLEAQGVTPTQVDSIRAWGDSTIWLAVTLGDATGRVLRSTDGGASFRLWNLNLPTNAGINEISIINPNIVFVGGDPYAGSAFISRTKSKVVGLF